MNHKIGEFIRVKHIDSFQKLRFLLFLHQHPDVEETAQGFAEQLYLGDVPLLAEIITDLQNVGLVECVGGRCMIHNEPDVRTHLQCLAGVFEDPLARQNLLEQVGHSPSRYYYQESDYEHH